MRSNAGSSKENTRSIAGTVPQQKSSSKGNAPPLQRKSGDVKDGLEEIISTEPAMSTARDFRQTIKSQPAKPPVQMKSGSSTVMQLKLSEDDEIAFKQYYEDTYAESLPREVWNSIYDGIRADNDDLEKAKEELDTFVAEFLDEPVADDKKKDEDSGDEEDDAAPAAAAGAAAPAAAPAVAPAAAPAAAPVPATPVAVTNFMNASPSNYVRSGGQRGTLASTRWFKVLYGDKDFSLHIHVDARGTINHGWDKIKNRDGSQEYYVHLDSSMNAAVKDLNPFKKKK